MIVPISTLVGLLTISTLFETASGTPTKRNLGPLTTQFLGDKTRAGVSLTSVDDRNLVTLGGKSRRPVRIQFWCGADGPISMIPWYKTPGEPDLTAIHWTWGADPPYGTYKELHIEHGKEWINRIEYRVCGPANNKKVCFLYVGTINSEGNVQYILCGNDPTKDYYDYVQIGTGDTDMGNRAFLAFAGTTTKSGFAGLESHWVDLAEY